VGRVVVVGGTVMQVEGDRWLNVRLNDGTGEMVVYLPERVVPYLPGGIGPGVSLRVTGQVDVYRGVLEIIPLAGADVQVGP
jgi:DNA/RNA endonuclease YhcR with UshA esterase domain